MLGYIIYDKTHIGVRIFRYSIGIGLLYNQVILYVF